MKTYIKICCVHCHGPLAVDVDDDKLLVTPCPSCIEDIRAYERGRAQLSNISEEEAPEWRKTL